MNNDNVYRKVGRRYEPIGVFYNRDWLTDGIWYVRKNGSHITNGKYLMELFKISDKPICEDFSQYCDLDDHAETVLNDPDFRELMNSQKGYSLNDIVHMTIAVLKKKANEQKKSLRKNNKSNKNENIY